MSILEETFRILDETKEELTDSLGKLISIPSVAVDEESNTPFGEAVDKAFRYMLAEGEKAGFSSYNADNYGGHIQFGGSGNETLGIIGHLDVVPEGKDWVYEPFALTEDNGKLYGRGVTDDKGPVMACFYAMKALKEAGFKPEKNIRLVFGLDEETNWKGMDYYLEKTDAPDFGFTPDGDFPVIHGEMGILVFDIADKFGRENPNGLKLRSIKGGNAPNMVPDYCRVTVLSDRKEDYDSIRDKVDILREQKKYSFNTRQIGKSFEIISHGVSAHGARPEHGLNAISIMMELLGTLNFNNDDMNGFIDFYNRHIGFETDGNSIGLGLSDEVSGNLIFNAGMIDLDKNKVTLTINVRYPVTMDDKKVYEALEPVMEKYNFGVIKNKHQLPIFIPSDTELIEKLMKVYEKHTGDSETKPLVIGGGTYARAVDNVVAFGARLPYQEEVGHQKNEYIEKEHLFLLTRIYAEAIYELAR